MFSTTGKIDSSYKNLWKSNEDADFTITCHDAKFLVHKRVLSARSSVFGLMFQNEFGGRGDACILDTTPEVLRLTFEWMYTNAIADFSKLVTKDLCDLISSADKYDLNDLKEICMTKLCEDLRFESVAEVLKITSMYDDDDIPGDLAKRLETYCHSNFSQLVLDPRFCEFIKGHSIFQTLSSDQRSQLDQYEQEGRKPITREWNINFIDEIDKRSRLGAGEGKRSPAGDAERSVDRETLGESEQEEEDYFYEGTSNEDGDQMSVSSRSASSSSTATDEDL